MKPHYTNSGIFLLVGFLLLAVFSSHVFLVSGEKVTPPKDNHSTYPVKNMQGSIYLPSNCQHFSWSPDGERIAFSSYRCKTSDIYVVDADGHNLKRLTQNLGASLPVWSPDGEKIAFTAVNGNSDIFVMNTDGSNLKRLTQDSNSDLMFKWLSDGRIIFFRGNWFNYELYTMDADGGNQKQFIDLSAWSDCRSLTFSPDNRRIAFSAVEDDNWDIFVVDINGSNPHRLTTTTDMDTSPEWSPDGKKIAFGSLRDLTTSGIYIMNADGTSPEKIFDYFEERLDLEWSPDGKTILFSTYEYRTSEIIAVNTGDAFERLIMFNALITCPVWSPDGKKIAFVSSENQVPDIFVINSDGSNLVNISHTPEDWMSPRYCFADLPPEYWFAFAIVILVSVFIYFRIVRKHVDRKTRIGLRAGFLCGMTFFSFQVIVLMVGLDVPGKYFGLLLLILCAVPGILIVIIGKDIILSTRDIAASSAAAVIVFSLLYIFSLIISDISGGTYPFRNDPVGDIIFYLSIFGMTFYFAFMLSTGLGVLARRIMRPPEEVIDHSPDQL